MKRIALVGIPMIRRDSSGGDELACTQFRFVKPRTLSVTFRTALLCAALLLNFVPAAAGAASIDEQTVTIAKQLKCPVCQNVPVAYSQAQLAGEMRQVIREKLAQGESKDAIIQYFVDRYGEDVLLEPRREGFSLWLWISSIGVLLFGAAVAGAVLWNWSQTRPASSPGISAPTDSSQMPSSRLEQVFEDEFARYKQDKRT